MTTRTPESLVPDQENPRDSGERPESLPPAVEECLNCHHRITGQFCSNCGQEATDRTVPVRMLLKETFYDYVNLDSKLLRSLKPLVSRPGYLTEAYNRGERVRYVLPPRLYLIISILFFFLVVNFDPLEPEEYSGLGTVELNQKLAEKKMSRELFDVRYQNEVEENLPLWMFTIIPLFAFTLKLFYIRQRRFLVEHLIFSFHFFSLAFLALLPALLLHDDVVTWVALIGIMVYLFLALRRVYRQSWWMTSLKGAALSIYFLVLIVFYTHFVGAFSAGNVLE